MLFSATVNFIKSGGTDKGGAPGYVSGQSVRLVTLSGETVQNYTFSADVADASGSCLLTNLTTTQIYFNSPLNAKCNLTDCNGNLFIKSILPSSTLYVPRYGDNSASLTSKDLVQIKLSTRSQTCSIPAKQTLTFVYSYSGTLVDPQYYIVSALVTYS